MWERRNSGFDQVRHSGESIWYGSRLIFAFLRASRSEFVADTMDSMGMPSSPSSNSPGLTFPTFGKMTH